MIALTHSLDEGNHASSLRHQLRQLTATSRAPCPRAQWLLARRARNIRARFSARGESRMERRCGSAARAGSIAALTACALAGVAFAQTPAQPAETSAPAAQAAPPPAPLQGDAHRGRELSYTCLGC